MVATQKTIAQDVSHSKGREGKRIEDIYQKKTQLEHILLRPDTYVGSIEAQTQDLWVFDSVRSRMVFRSVRFVPALYKIFDEILVNAADNFHRDPKGMDTIKVDIDAKLGEISVMNNGQGLPVEVHRDHGVYIPEMVFGHLLTSDNYNDGEGRVVGGRNGYGAKLANVFSTQFTIETCDGQKRFSQTFLKNMSQKLAPKVVIANKEKPFTKVIFRPDLAKFGMTILDDDTVSLLTKRVYDIAGTTADKVIVHLNGEQLDVKNFRDYTDLYLLTRQDLPQIYEKCSDRWEVCLSLTEAGFQQVSFVNSICTTRGGTHVTHVTDQIVESLLVKVKEKSKDMQKGGVDIRPHHVRNHLWIFARSLIENPAFDGQTKEALTTKQSKFGSKCELSEKFMEKVLECGIVDLILMSAMAKSKTNLAKNLKAGTSKVTRLTGVPKLEDANDAGGKSSAECTLILTEGDSAKALAVAGLSVIGRDKYGVFPLRGKLLNVRDATLKQLMDNAEIQNIIKIMGLDLNREYDAELKGLRYGSLMIMADQDLDGSHIKGLLINLVHAWWPSLAKQPSFIKEFFTPIVKATKGKTQLSFYTMPEYNTWSKETDNGKGFKVKYYKGLGTSTAKEAKEYFSQLDGHRLSYKHESTADDNAIDLAFNKKRADDRKEWITNCNDEDLVDHTAGEVTYGDFINKELVQFARASVVRAIPSVVDGMKPSQRKILFGCFKRKLKNDAKVAQLVGYVSEQAAYHHGETSLEGTIIGMAQDFVGSNNVNLLVPQGQFGTRLLGGKDSASSRYIYTRLAPVTRFIFREEDDHVLEFLQDDGLKIEPKWYCPIIPMVLVNGADGIGTGWATSVPNFNPADIIANLKRYIKGQELKEMMPWYAGFRGPISEGREDGKVEVCGIIESTGDNTAVITELPVKKWTQDYRELLEENLIRGNDKKKDADKLLEDYSEHHTEKTVHFELVLSAAGVEKSGNLMSAFRLRSSISMVNMMLFDAGGTIKKYESPLQIIEEFAATRLELYDKRKAFLVNKLTRECDILSAKARFIKLVIERKLAIKRRKIKDLSNDLRRLGFKPFDDIKDKEGEGAGAEGEDGEEEGEEKDAMDVDEGAEAEGDGEENPEAATRKSNAKDVRDFEYLVGMPISTLTAERIEELMKQVETKKKELDALKRKTISKMWLDDLEELETALAEREAIIEKDLQAEQVQLKKAKGKRAETGKASAKRGLKRTASNPADAGRGAKKA